MPSKTAGKRGPTPRSPAKLRSVNLLVRLLPSELRKVKRDASGAKITLSAYVRGKLGLE